MLKTILTALAVIFLLATLPCAFAEMNMVVPEIQPLQNKSSFDIGALQPGETLEIVFSTRTGNQDYEWTSLTTPNIPVGWVVQSTKKTEHTHILKIKTSPELKTGMYTLQIKLSNPALKKEETANLQVHLKQDLITASITGLNQQAEVGKPVSYLLTINNQSIASHNLTLYSDLSPAWFTPVEYNIPPKKIVETKLTLNPGADGLKKFKFHLTSRNDNSNISEFNAVLSITPTLKSKYSAPLYGFPFFTFSLTPFHELLSLAGYLI